ncbi:MAG TPA: hypothetical protein V6D07_09780 [Trichocoleus sp.]
MISTGSGDYLHGSHPDFDLQISADNLRLIIESLSYRVLSLPHGQRRDATERVLISLTQIKDGKEPQFPLATVRETLNGCDHLQN